MAPKYPALSEGNYAAAHLVSDEDANGHRSRETIVIAAGANLKAGTVLGKVTASGKYKALTPGAEDGSQTAAGILYGPAPAAAADVRGVANVRETVVNAGEITWPNGITTNDKNAAIAALAALQIVLR